MKTAIAADMTVIAGDINEMKREGENIAKTVIVETDVTEPDGGGCKNQELLVEASAMKFLVSLVWCYR